MNLVNINMYESKLKEAVKILQDGGIVIYPTDTAFGIGCRIDSEKSIKKLFEMKKRPPSQAVPVLISSQDMAERYFLSPLPDNVRHLMDAYWPGALTIVYNCKKDLIPPLVRGGADKVGLRMPDYEIPLALIKEVGVPILGPSANFHKAATPFEYNQLDKSLIRLVDYVIEGKCSVGNVSTVIDATCKQWKIIRQGAVKVTTK